MPSKVDTDESQQLSGWLSRREAATFLNCTVATIRRFENEKLLTPKVQPGTRGGRIVYDPEEVESLKGTPQIEVAQHDELVGKELQTAVVEFARLSAEHAEALHKLVEDPSRELLQMALNENAALRQRIEHLEKERTVTFDKMEEMRSKQHEREMGMMQWAANNERKEAMFKLVVENAPKLTQQIVASGQAPKMLESLSGLAKSLKPDQVVKLMEVLDEDQAMKFANVMNTVKDDKKNCGDDAPHELLE